MRRLALNDGILPTAEPEIWHKGVLAKGMTEVTLAHLLVLLRGGRTAPRPEETFLPVRDVQARQAQLSTIADLVLLEALNIQVAVELSGKPATLQEDLGNLGVLGLAVKVARE